MTYKPVVIDPSIANGAPVLQGTATPVHKVLTQLAETMPAEVLAQLPSLELADVKAALAYAATVVHQQATTAPQNGELNLNKILLVDDVPENLVLMEYMFKNSSYTILMASNAQDALSRARAELPALIISDISMPQTSGLDLLTALKADEQTQNIAVILVTAHHRDSKRLSQGLLMGADDYIYRPFMQDEFLSRIEAVMRVKRAELEIKRQARVVARRNKGLELVNELAVAVNSSLDSQDIFASAMQKLSQLLEAEAVSLVLIDDDNQDLLVDISSRTGKRISVSYDLSKIANNSNTTRQSQIQIVILNLLSQHYLELGITTSLDQVTIQSVPMQLKESTIGAIAIINKQGEPFDEADWALLYSAAGIIAVAVENAHLLTSTQQQVDDLIALNEIGRILTSTLDLQQILKQTTLLMQRTLNCEAASLWVLDDLGHQLVMTAASGLGSEDITGYRLGYGRGIAGYVVHTGEPYTSNDVSADGHYYQGVAQLTNYSPGSILAVPVRLKSRTVGVLEALHSRTNWFDDNDLHLASPVANFVGIAMENARLFKEVQDFNRQLEGMVAERTRELANEKEKTEAILASMADGLLVLDAENRILASNTVAEGMLNFPLSQSVGQPVTPEQLEQPLWQAILRVAGSVEPWLKEVVVDVAPAETGAVLSIQAHAARVKNEAGQTIGTVIVLRDVTTLKAVERMKARFMAGVTHELKTPLSIIRLHSKNLLAYHDRLPPVKRVELLQAIQTQLNLLEHLIEDILTLSRLDAEGIQAEQHPVDLVELLNEVVNNLRPLAEAKQINLAWQKPPERITVQAKPDHLERVARNLIDNAIRYTLAGGSVQVRTGTVQKNNRTLVELWVIDSGIGIPVEHQARVFERFYRVDPSHTIPGTGLGLAIVKELVNAHGGQIRLRSAPGQGTTFVVTLPGITSGDIG
jgi:signal transduction histidine kinase/DNA-binding response OmpR family regulator/uncharacterized protein (DUF433 family)